MALGIIIGVLGTLSVEFLYCMAKIAETKGLWEDSKDEDEF